MGKIANNKPKKGRGQNPRFFDNTKGKGSRAAQLGANDFANVVRADLQIILTPNNRREIITYLVNNERRRILGLFVIYKKIKKI